MPKIEQSAGANSGDRFGIPYSIVFTLVARVARNLELGEKSEKPDKRNK